MPRLLLLSFFLLTFIVVLTGTASIVSTPCTSDASCGQYGVCNLQTRRCKCTEPGYVTVNSREPCGYKQKNKLTAFLFSLLLGALGADWFYLSAGNVGYIVAGVFKLLTGGGLGIWAIVDFIRILANGFRDGQGVPLRDWS